MKLLLIGAGNMGLAMLDGLSKHDISVVVKDDEKMQILQTQYQHVKFLTAIPKLDEFLVILAIKPKSLESLHVKGCAKGLISILAGVSIKELKTKIPAFNYVRAMPNMAALQKCSTTSLCGDSELKQRAMKILQSIGECFWLESEDELDIAMAISACSPAWMALVAEALSDGAVNLGFKRSLSYEMIASTFKGVGSALEHMHPALLKDKVTSPKGTTIAGYKALEKRGVRNAFLEALEDAYKRAKKD